MVSCLNLNNFIGIAPNDCTQGDFLLANLQKFCGDTLANGMLVGMLNVNDV
jgi:hypothetical protein